MRKGLFIITVILALFLCAGALAQYRTLNVGDSGEDVLALKTRMYELGFFSTNNFSDEYNAVTQERVKKLQKLNGLEQTGEATTELQELIFSDLVVNSKGKVVGEQPTKKPTATPKPTKTPKPTATPKATIAPVTTPALPQTDDKGFLLDDEEFVFSDADDGHWMYRSNTLQVEIKRYEDPNQLVLWYETDIKTAGDERMTTYLTEGKTPGRAVKRPQLIARANKVVLGFSDDYFGYRIRNKSTVGIIVRGGTIYSEKTKKPGASGFPNLDTLAYFADGSMKTFPSNAHTAQEYLDMGATDVLAFGPALVSAGQLGVNMTDTFYHYREPRCAIGMIEPNHYILLTVKGRVNNSKGVYLPWLANKMLELGAQEALNLDGGGTAALIFMGEQINTKNSAARAVTSILGFGTSDKVPD